MASTTFCTYTYNDANLAHELLAGLRHWTRQPDEILVLDDGSAVPFQLAGSYEESLPLRIIRLDSNQGFKIAKSTCISAARGEIILAADCDARLDPAYLERCCEHLAEPGVGMVGGVTSNIGGQGLLSEYLHLFVDNYTCPRTGPVDFIPGLAFAMRRAVWEEVGGFGEHQREVCEDHSLCAALRARGYTLIMDREIAVRQARRLSRLAHCRRMWLWCGVPLAEQAPAGVSLPEQFLVLFANPMLERAAHILTQHSPAYMYYELLYAAYAGLEFCAALGRQGRIPPPTARLFLAGLEQGLGRYPRLWRLLKSDLLRLGVFPPPAGLPPAPADHSRLASRSDWSEALIFLELLGQNGCLAWLDERGAQLVLEDEARTEADFSSYLARSN